jgi:hypothetical protein
MSNVTLLRADQRASASSAYATAATTAKAPTAARTIRVGRARGRRSNQTWFIFI